MDIIKIFVYKVIRTCIRFFAFFPIKKNRLLFESYKGNSYSCNPKYICEYLMKNHKNMYEIIWILNSPDKATLPPKIKTVKKKSIANFYYHLTAKVIITNMTDDVYIPKRKEQIIINTWHAGGAYKKVGLSYDKTNSILMKWQNKIVRDETSYYVSSSELFSKYNIQDAYHYNGKIINSGMPRNDIFFDNTKINFIKSKLSNLWNISGKQVILYAPTFRGDFGKAESAEFVFPFIEIINAFKQYEKEIIILNRSHYSVSNAFKTDIENIMDVSDYPDMQELLVIADILITDYSSSMWDFSLTGKPCIFYVPDKEQYLSDRGTYTPMEKWPGLIASTKDELLSLLLNNDVTVYKSKAEASLDFFASYETGNATRILCNLINEVCTYDFP